MCNWTFWLLAALYLSAGAVVLKFFRKMRMRVALGLFSVLYVLIALYIPMVLGSEFLVELIRPFYADLFMPEKFSNYMRSPLLSLMPYFSVTSIVTVAIAVIVGIAALLLAVKAVRYVVRRIRVRHKKKLFVYRKKPVFRLREVRAKPKRIYLSFCRLLN